MNFLLPQEFGNQIMAYLVKQPYSEVASLIQGLQSLSTANVAQPTDVPTVPTEPEVTEPTA